MGKQGTKSFARDFFTPYAVSLEFPGNYWYSTSIVNIIISLVCRYAQGRHPQSFFRPANHCSPPNWPLLEWDLRKGEIAVFLELLVLELEPAAEVNRRLAGTIIMS